MSSPFPNLLKSISKTRTLKKGETVFQLGQPAEAIYKVIRGQVHLYRHDQDGRRVLLYRAYDDHFFAEASLNSQQYHCTAVCIKPTDIEIFNAKQLLDLLNTNPDFALSWISLLSSELRRQRASVERLNIKSARERIRHYVMTEGEPWGELHLKGTMTDWSEVLGLTRETLYRTLSDMEKQGELERIDSLIRLTPFSRTR